MARSRKPADWKRWGGVATWTHLQAVCLTLDLEPFDPQSKDAAGVCGKESLGLTSDLRRMQLFYQEVRVCFPKHAAIDRTEFVTWVIASSFVKPPAKMVQMLGDDLHLPRYSIKQVAHAVAEQEGWHADARDVLRDQMQRDVGNSPLLPGYLAIHRLDDDIGSAHLVDAANASAWLSAKRGIAWPQARPTSGMSALEPLELPVDKKEKRAELLRLFREDGGRRPKESKKGSRGALARLERRSRIDDKNLGEMLDKAIDEEREGAAFAQLTKTVSR